MSVPNDVKELIGGLFDSSYYAGDGIPYEEALEHFLEKGWLAGRKPNPSFDPAFYLRRYPDVATSGLNPLIHYALLGRKQGRASAPPFSHERM